MRKSITAMSIAAALVVAFLASPALHAQHAGGESHGAEAPKSAPGTMNMKGQTDGMMEHCSQMMGGDQADSGRPNDQRRDGALPAGRPTGRKQ